MARSDLDRSLIDGEGLDKGSSTTVYSSLGFDFFLFFLIFIFAQISTEQVDLAWLDYIMDTPKFLHHTKLLNHNT